MTDTKPGKGRTIAYWVTTALVTLSFCASGLAELAGVEDAVKGFPHLGYPAYFITLLGTAKVLGGLTVALPKFPRLKEWAYAGIVIDLIAAAYSHLSVGDGVKEIVTPLVVLAIVATSYVLRPADRRLPDPG